MKLVSSKLVHNVAVAAHYVRFVILHLGVASARRMQAQTRLIAAVSQAIGTTMAHATSALIRSVISVL